MPNLLFIILDTQRRDRLSLYGYARATSPRLDDFAAAGRVYEAAVAPAQWTISSHASMFTGLYPYQHATNQANHRLPEALTSVVEWLRAGGYHTVGFCNNPLIGLIDNGLDRGFERFYHYASPAPQRPTRRPLPPVVARSWRGFSQFTRRTINRFAQNEALFRASLHPLISPIWSRWVNYKGSVAASTHDLRAYWHQHRRSSSQPIFAFLNLMGTHMPLRPPRQWIDHIAPELRHNRAALRWMAAYNGDGLRWISPAVPPLTDWQQQALGAVYDAAAAEQDHYLGAMLAAMQADGDLDDTLVIIGADHGEGLGDHGYCGHSFVVNHELTHVPWLMWWRGNIAPAREPSVISTRRVFHTLLDAAGLGRTLPIDDPAGSVERLSLLRANGEAEQNTALSEAYPATTLLNTLRYRMPGIIEQRRLSEVRRAVVRGEHKLTTVGDDPEALYHLPTDPAEQVNHLSAQPALSAELHDVLRGALASAASAPAPQDFSPPVLDNLRALGYLD